MPPAPFRRLSTPPGGGGNAMDSGRSKSVGLGTPSLESSDYPAASPSRNAPLDVDSPIDDLIVGMGILRRK